MTKQQNNGKVVRVVNLGVVSARDSDRLITDGHETWKFIVLSTPEAINLVLGPVPPFKYHANLVDEFCRKNQVVSHWIKKPDLVEVLDPGVIVLGGGHLKVASDGRVAKFYGRSNAYGVCNSTLLKEITRDHPAFSGVTVIVDQP